MSGKRTLLRKVFSVANEYSNGNKRKVITLAGVRIKIKRENETEVKSSTVHYLIAMLKAYGIHNIISSPGCQNAMFNLIVQDDDYFNCYSVTDERSAAFTASGIAEETGEPVVITCTGSSASRNYIPALTEAFYRNVPIIAIPFYNRASNEYNLAAQFTDRSITQKDIKTVQVKLPEIQDDIDKKRVLTYLNAAIFEAKYNKKPVIIECPSVLNFSVINKTLPDNIWKTELIEDIKNTDKDYLKNKNIAVFIGSHSKFTEEEQEALSNFAISYNAPVFCDHTSNYKGKNKILSARASIVHISTPDLIIDIGGVTGDYFARGLFDNAEIWRISPKGKFNCRYDLPVTKIFAMKEILFFNRMCNETKSNSRYSLTVQTAVDGINISELPLSNCLIIQNLAKYLPKNCILHHGVSNTKRAINFFDFSDTIDISCNVGVCGIDGVVSTAAGHAVINPYKKCFLVLGDLTFFYDMNVLQNRDIKNNLRILLINNNKGVEFKVNGLFGGTNAVEKLIASAGHRTNAKGWALSCGFHYMSCSTKEEFLNQINDFCNKDFDKPVLFEVFTKDEDEQKALELIIKR